MTVDIRNFYQRNYEMSQKNTKFRAGNAHLEQAKLKS